MLQLPIYSHSTSNAKVHSLQETVLDGAPWRQICCDVAVPFGIQLTTKEKSIGRIIYHMTHMPMFSFPLFFRGWSVFTWAYGWACYSSEFTDLEPGPVGITNIWLILKIMLGMAAEQKKFILNLVTNYRTNRNVQPALKFALISTGGTHRGLQPLPKWRAASDCSQKQWERIMFTVVKAECLS